MGTYPLKIIYHEIFEEKSRTQQTNLEQCE